VEGERLHRQALDARRRLLGVDHPATFETAGNLAFSLLRLGRAPEAMRLASAALATSAEKLGDDHSTTARIGMVVGLCQSHTGRFPETESTLRRALEGADESPVLKARTEAHLAIVVGNEDRRGEADSLFQRALVLLPDWDAETQVILSGMLPLYEAWRVSDSTGAYAEHAAELRRRRRSL
jgi:tetratricopeptide (TPR) repeat protein